MTDKFDAWFQDQDNDEKFQEMVQSAIAGGVIGRGWSDFLHEQGKGWLNAQSPQEKHIRRICITNLLRFENEQRESVVDDVDDQVSALKRSRDHENDEGNDEGDGKIKELVVSFSGRTGPKRAKISGVLSKDNDLIKIRLDDEENLEFWAEAYISTSQLKEFLQ